MFGDSPSRRLTTLLIFILLILVGAGLAAWIGLGPGTDERTGSGNARATPLWTPLTFTLDLAPSPGGWRVEGHAALGDGMRVSLEIAYDDPDGEPFISEEAVVSGGVISIEFGPYPAPFPSGTYILRVRPVDRPAFVVATHRIGDAERAAREAAEAKTHFLRLLDAAREAMLDLGVGAMDAREGKRFVDPSGTFFTNPWRQWLEEIVGGTLRWIDDSQRAYREMFALDRHPAASEEVVEIVAEIRDLMRFTSAEVHRHHGAAPPPGAAPQVAAEAIDSRLDALAERLHIAGRALPPGDRTEKVDAEGISITRRQRGRTSILKMEGGVKVPDGCQYVIDLRFHRPEHASIVNRRAEGPYFGIQIHSMDRSLPSGTYFLQIQMEYQRQHPSVRLRIDEEAPHLRGGLRKMITFRLGTDKEAEDEEEARLGHYRDVLGDAAHWFWEMRDRLEDASRAEAFVDPDGKIDLDEIRRWNEEQDGQMAALRERHEAFRRSTLAPKYESEDRSVAQLLRAISEQKDRALASLLGRPIDSGPFRIEVGIVELNSLIRKDICGGVGLPPVSLGSLRLGEARRAKDAGDMARALEILLRLGVPEVGERAVEGLSLSAAAEIYLREGREWRAMPLLETLAERRRYRGLTSAEKGKKEIDRIRRSTDPWAIAKQQAYHDDLSLELEQIRMRLDEGRFEAAEHLLIGWEGLEKGHRDLFGARISDPAIRSDVDGLLASARKEASRRMLSSTYLKGGVSLVETLVQMLGRGDVDGFRKGMEEELVPFLEQMRGVGVPAPIIRRVSGRAEAARAEATRIDAARAALEGRGVRAVGVTESGEVLFRLPGIVESVSRRPGEMVIEGLYLLEVRDTEDGKVIFLRLGRSPPFPLAIPGALPVPR